MKQYLRVSPKTKEQARLIPKWIKPWKEYEVIEDQMRHIIDEFGQKTLVLIVQVHLHKFNVQIVKPSQPRWTKDQKAFIDLLKKHNALQDFIVYLIVRRQTKLSLFEYFKTINKESWVYGAFWWGYELGKWARISDEWEAIQ